MCAECHPDAEQAIELISRMFDRHRALTNNDARLAQDRVLIDAEIHHVDRVLREGS